MAITTDSEFAFAASPGAVCAALADTERYQSWWPWLTEFEASGLHAGARWRCAVRSPMALTLRFEIHIDEVSMGEVTSEDATSEDVTVGEVPTGRATTSETSVTGHQAGGLEVRATLSGDIVGTAQITISGRGERSDVRFVSTLNPKARLLSAVSALAPPLARKAHDQVVRAAAHQFRDALTSGLTDV